jgi:hypothetical protein
MDAAAIKDLVATLGFPIVAALALGFVIWTIARWAMRTGDRLAARFETHVDELGQTQKEIKPQLDRIETAVTASKCRAPGLGLPAQFTSAEPAASH